MLPARSDEFWLVHERRNEIGETRESLRSEVRGFRNCEPRTSDRAFLAYLALPAWLVWFIWSIWSIWFVWFNQIIETDQVTVFLR